MRRRSQEQIWKDPFENEWLLVFQGYQPEQEGLREALCTLGNGYCATRGATPESEADGIHYPGTYFAGFYNRLRTNISGRTVENESIVNTPNWLPLRYKIEDGDWFNLRQAKIHHYIQELDLCNGMLHRNMLFEDSSGRTTCVHERRFISMAEPELAGLEMTFVAENWSGKLHILSALDSQVANNGVARYRQLNNHHLEPIEAKTINDETILLKVETKQSHIRIAEAARTRIFHGEAQIPCVPLVNNESGYISQEFSIHLNQMEPVTVEKIVSLVNSRIRAISSVSIEAEKKVKRAGNYETLLQKHRVRWEHLWQRCSITISNNKNIARILNLHIFHLLQTVSLNTIDIDAGVPARGLHGEAYHGHIFWDELFIFPFLNLRIPDITRSLLMYRYRRLPEAKWAAKQEGYQGAMYPWQSGSDGREETQTLHLNPISKRWLPDKSHRQRHINIAIVYNIWMYYQVTGDIDFLLYYGAEMIIEIARFWASIAQYNPSLKKYEIHNVMGPDEYHDGYPDTGEPGLRNNAYTNIMAVWVLCRTLELLDILPEDRCKNIWDNLGLTSEELALWESISRKMRIVFHDGGIISQFEGYNELQEFDWRGYQKKYGNIQRLDRILEAEGDNTNRYKVSKQADVLMLFYLLSAEELRGLFERLGYSLEPETIPKNIEYYINRTSHGSTLSRIVHSWVLARSDRDLSWNLFKEALNSDVADIQGGTTAEGIHLGAVAGTVDLMQRCYTGVETRGDILRFNPQLPRDLDNIELNLTYRRNCLNVQIDHKRLLISTKRYTVGPINIGFNDQVMELKPGDSVELQI
ncbi:glycoside hydrolase family 65 protein [Chloroflexota bacterium]